jgi:hypothetical protein
MRDPAGTPHHFIHSGNFFSQPYVKKPELRTKERILDLQEKLINKRTDGFTTLNVPVNGNLTTPYWKRSKRAYKLPFGKRRTQNDLICYTLALRSAHIVMRVTYSKKQ